MVNNIELLLELSNLSHEYFPLVFKVDFVADQEYKDIHVGVILSFIEPYLDFIEALITYYYTNRIVTQ